MYAKRVRLVHTWSMQHALYMSMIANNALLGGGVRVRVRVWIREQRKIKRRSKVLLSLCWQSWTSLAWISAASSKCVYMNEGLNRSLYSSTGGTIEIHNRMVFSFYPGLAHLVS